jgi:hypothetical protein
MLAVSLELIHRSGSRPINANAQFLRLINRHSKELE